MNSLKFLLSYFLICSLNVNSQVLVKDLNPGTGNSVEDYGTKTLQIDEKIFFIAWRKKVNFDEMFTNIDSKNERFSED